MQARIRNKAVKVESGISTRIKMERKAKSVQYIDVQYEHIDTTTITCYTSY